VPPQKKLEADEAPANHAELLIENLLEQRRRGTAIRVAMPRDRDRTPQEIAEMREAMRKKDARKDDDQVTVAFDCSQRFLRDLQKLGAREGITASAWLRRLTIAAVARELDEE
jgi:hypothetical protein